MTEKPFDIFEYLEEVHKKKVPNNQVEDDVYRQKTLLERTVKYQEKNDDNTTKSGSKDNIFEKIFKNKNKDNEKSGEKLGQDGDNKNTSSTKNVTGSTMSDYKTTSTGIPSYVSATSTLSDNPQNNPNSFSITNGDNNSYSPNILKSISETTLKAIDYVYKNYSTPNMGTCKRVTDKEVYAMARKMGATEEQALTMVAIVKTESGGKLYESDGKTPINRYEPHINDYSIGITQVLTKTAEGLYRAGHTKYSPKDLANPEAAIYFGLAHLQETDKYYTTHASKIPVSRDEFNVRAYNGGPGWYKGEKATAMTEVYYAKHVRHLNEAVENLTNSKDAPQYAAAKTDAKQKSPGTPAHS